MLEKLLGLIVIVMLGIAITKSVKRFLSRSKIKSTETDIVEAAISLDRFEERISVLMKRELANQERIWVLEDENHALKMEIASLRKRPTQTP